MKKILLIAAMALSFVVTAVAANPLDKATGAIENKFGGKARAIGLRLGNGGELSYQHSLGANFVEVDAGLGLGFDGVFNVGATAVYNFMLVQPQWTDRGEWGVYAGPGASVGLNLGEVNNLTVGAAGMVGLEYSFWFPLQLSIDVKQNLGVCIGGERVIWSPTSIALGVRYRF